MSASSNTAASTVNVPICAIGASAGGVAALKAFFSAIPVDLGLAYVVILHLSPEHPSAMAEILAGYTSMSVTQVDDSPELKANCVYVIPPDRELVIQGNEIHARPFSEPRGRRAPIDLFFRSIAVGRGDGLAVVLSGSGSDGSVGVKAIYEGGGVVFVQDPSSAEFPMMPQNAIATGVVNFIGPIERLVERIAEVARSKEAVRSLDADGFANELRRIAGLLHARTGHDFSHYKRATVMRRVMRRMQVNRMRSAADYAAYLRETPEEAQELFADLLISVTTFFRDEAAFASLAQKGVGPLFDTLRDEGLRAWVVGCATGEEAYSIAMLLLEEAERRNVKAPIQIFASDLDEGALATGREGRYPRSIEADVSEERLKKFFIDEGAYYRIRKEVRDLVLFASHSVLKDPPFLRIDLISCRNLLIYLERTLQQQLAALFHYALTPNGVLFLGSAETIDASPLFATLDRDARLYKAKPTADRHLPRFPSLHGEQFPIAPATPRNTTGEKTAKPAAEIHLEALERHAPPSALVDPDHQIIHLSPLAGRFIQPSGGLFSGKLSVVVRPELRLDLQLGLDRAFQLHQPTMTPSAMVAFDDQRRHISLLIQPVAAEDDTVARALVLFLDAGPVTDADHALLENVESRPDEMRRLHAELRNAQEALVAIRNEHQISIQELRAANEELQSVNEEYRSTAEELETSKEELQSMNEELQTVNAELKAKLASISTAHSDLQNLTAATEIGTLFLDTEMRIRMFTPPVAGLFNITDADVGRLITSFTHRLDYDGLEQDARQVLRALTPVEREVRTRDGRSFMMRVRPYRTVEDRISGVVLTFVDVTERITAEQDLLQSELRYRSLFNSIDEGFCIIEVIFDDQNRAVDYRIEDINAAFERQTGLTNARGQLMREMQPNHEEHWFETYGRVASSRMPERFEAPAASLGRYYEVYAFPTGDPALHRVGVLFNDVSSRKEAERHRDMLTHELSHRVKNTLAVVQSLVNLPAPAGISVDEYRASLHGRVQALSRAHSQLLETRWRSVDLRALVRETLAGYLEPDSKRADIDGEPVELSPKQGISVALFLHELATNAAKYGALSCPEGRVAIRWAWHHGDMLRLHWEESGGPPVHHPDRTGFGTSLIKNIIAYQLGGEAKLSYEPQGVVSELAFKLASQADAT